MPRETEVVECSFPDCDWSHEYTLENGQIVDDYPTVRHYEKEHAGRVRVQVTLEREYLMRDTGTERYHDMARDRFQGESGYAVAHVRTEVLEEPDDHSKLADE